MKKIVSFMLGLILIGSSISTYAYTNMLEWEQKTDCVMTSEQRTFVEEKVCELIDELDLRDMERPKQIMTIQNWVNENIEYDYEFRRSYRTAYSGLMNGSTVCVGYCAIGHEFCKQLEIPCEIVFCGFDDEDGYETTHVVLLVQMENELWYYWDITAAMGYGNDLLMGYQDAEIVLGGISKYDFYSDGNVGDRQIAEMNYFHDYSINDYIEESAFINTVRRYLKHFSRISNTYTYRERPHYKDVMHNTRGYICKENETVFSFNFWVNEDNYGPFGCWYN